MRSRHTLPAMVTAFAVVAACGDNITNVQNTNFQAEADFANTFSVDNRTVLELTGINGAVSITGDAPAGSIIVDGTRRVRSESASDAQDHLDDIEVRITELASSLVVETIHLQSSSGRTYEVDYDISVPSGFLIDVVNLNGAIAVAQMDGDIQLVNTNGAIALADVTGDLDVVVTNGAIAAVATMDPGGAIDLRTTNGEIVLSIPTSTSATFEATIVNGPITITNLTLNNQTVTSTSVTGTLGGGNGTIRLGVTNGEIEAIGT